MFARTERLLLRPGWREDAPALAEAIADITVVSNLESAPWPYGIDDAEHYLTQPRTRTLPELLILLRTGTEPRLVGGIGLNGAHDDVELGFWIARAFWGLGLATEAACAVLDMARHTLGLRALTAAPFADAAPAQRVLKKLGFAPAGQTTRRSIARNALVPAMRFSRALNADSVAPITALAA